MSELGHVTIVYGKDGERVSVAILRIEPGFIVIDRDGEELRFNRRTGFEMKSGGSWSAWRLAGRDHRRLKETSGTE